MISSTDSMPGNLKEIPDSPQKLYIKGKLPKLGTKLLCVVGSRRYSTYGKEVCQKLISALAPYDICIVSGLALGINSIAHETALRHNVHTVAVLGSGLNKDAIYPKSNSRLAQRIIDSGGALLSEFEPNFKATPWSFAKRNQIMAGLSDLILVIEAEQKSDPLVTARLALDYNREVATVPGSVFSENSAGPHYLIRNGAIPIRNPDDLIEALDIKEDTQKTISVFDISDDERKILELLKEKPKSKAEIIQKSNLSITRFSSALSKLELRELIYQKLGKIYSNLQK